MTRIASNQDEVLSKISNTLRMITVEDYDRIGNSFNVSYENGNSSDEGDQFTKESFNDSLKKISSKKRH